MLKLISPFAFPDRMNTVIVEAHSRGVDNSWMRKNAASHFDGILKDLKPEKGYAYLHMLALGDGETYGCFFRGAPVQTLYGQKPIEEIKLDDIVLTHKGRYRPVTTLYESSYTGDRVSLTGLGLPEKIVSTANHPFKVVRRESLSPTTRFRLRQENKLEEVLENAAENAEKVRADEIRPGDYLIIKTELEPENEIPKEFDPYVLGFYVAEGCLAKEYKNISTKGEYKKLLFTGCLNDEAPWDSIGRTPCARCDSYTSEFEVRVKVGFKELAGKLDTWFGHLATDKRLHPDVWSWSKEDRIKFIAGYLDGDGCVSQKENRYLGTLTASTASRTLAFDMQRLMASIGIPASINKSTNKVSNGCFGKKDHPIYQISIGSYYSNILLEHTLRLKPHNRQFKHREASNLQLAKTYALIPVQKVEIDHIEDDIKYNIEVEEDHTYVVDVQVLNCNRNADYFSKKANQTYHDTFVKFGHVYKHHRNTDPKKASGKPIASAYNDEMRRVELLCKVAEDKWSSELDKFEKGEDLPVSMSCSVPFDTCSVCGNKAPNRSHYCDHLKYAMTTILEDGRQVYAINDHPTFFDISYVIKPADRTAYVLRKAASDSIISSAELAESEGIGIPQSLLLESAKNYNPYLQKKLAVLSKLSEMEKDIEADVVSTVRGKGLYSYQDALSEEVDIGDIETDKLKKSSQLWSQFAERDVALPLEIFVKLSGEFISNEELKQAKFQLPGLFTRILTSPMALDICENSEYDKRSSQFSKSAWNSFWDNYSLKEEVLANKSIRGILRGVKSNIKSAVWELPRENDVLLKYASYKISLALNMNEDTQKLLVLQNYVN
jgi:hypothetical protein